MKIRQGFVSNSSSSSFICDVTGEEHSGYDCSPYDYDYYECCNGHIFPQDMIVGELSDDDDRYELDEKYCPICSKKVGYYPTSDRILTYLCNKLNIDVKNIEKEFKELELTDEYVKKYK